MKKMKLLFYLGLITSSLISGRLDAQPCGPYPSPDNCQMCVGVSLPAAATICSGSTYSFTPSVTIPAGFDIKTWSWSGSTVVPSSGGPALPGLTTIIPPPPISTKCNTVSYPYTLTVTGLGPNIITDGDFNYAPPAAPLPPFYFCTHYMHVPPPALNNTKYTVCSNGNMIPGGPAFPDHSTPASSMLIGQADPNVNIIWQQEVSVCLGETYDFSYYQATLSASPCTLWVHIIDANGGVTSTAVPNTVTGIWQTSPVLTWTNPTTPACTTATVMITGNSMPGVAWSTMPFGTTFAIDDISLRRQCKASQSMTVDVEYPEISGPKTVCVGSKIKFIGCKPGGTWGTSGGAIVDAFGNVTGITPGAATVFYTTPSGCMISYPITVNAAPVISGPSSICTGSTMMWSTAPASGTWTTSSHLYNWTPGPSTTATILGFTAGIGTIMFTDGTTGCKAVKTVTVNQTPDPIPPVSVCAGFAGLTLVGTPAGGTWSCAPATVATIGATTGTVNAVAAGVATVSYTSPAGCAANSTITVYNCGGGVGIIGSDLCEGQSATFSTITGIAPGGTWTSSNTSVATVNPTTGLVTAVGGGTVTITYSGPPSVSITITVYPAQTACVSTIITPTNYSFDFTTTCPGGTIHYYVTDFLGTVLGMGTTTAGVIPYSTIAATYGTSAFQVCVTGVQCGPCWWPSTCCATVNPGHKPSSVDDAGDKSKLSIMPNPNKGNFVVNGVLSSKNDATEMKLEVIDMMGKVVLTDYATIVNGVMNKNISLDNIANGIYSIRISGGNEISSLKFVVER